ncbi:MAG: SDR family oxidoreductase [Bryobacteraceae bacterium]
MSDQTAPQCVLITGASTGLGKLASLTAARAGHKVYAGMRDSGQKNREARDEMDGIARSEALDLHVVDLDVTVTKSAEEAVAHVINDAGRLDVLVNNAGYMSIGIAEGFSEEQIRRQMDVNFFGPVMLSRAVLPHMRKRKSGLIIHVTSILGRVMFPACAFYCASKFALEAYAEVLHYELTPLGIDSVLVEPGPFPTHLLANSPGPDDQSRTGGYEQLSALRETFIESFSQFFASSEAPNPQLVADAVLNLIDAPAGARPLRTVCGPDYGALTINQQAAPVQAEVLRALGMPDLAQRAQSA